MVEEGVNGEFAISLIGIKFAIRREWVKILLVGRAANLAIFPWSCPMQSIGIFTIENLAAIFQQLLDGRSAFFKVIAWQFIVCSCFIELKRVPYFLAKDLAEESMIARSSAVTSGMYLKLSCTILYSA